MDVVLPDGTTVKGIPEGTTRAQLAQKLQANGRSVPKEWLEPKTPDESKAQSPSDDTFGDRLIKGAKETGNLLGSAAKASMAIPEAAANIGSHMVALPFEAAASVGKLISAPWGQKAQQAAGASQAVEDAMVIEPQTVGGKGITKAVGTVLGIPTAVGEAAEGAVQRNLEGKGIPKTAETAEVAARMAPEIAATLLAAKGGATAGARAGVETAAETARKAAVADAPNAAKQFVESKAKLDWNALPKQLKDRITTIARDPKTLEKLDPEVIKREARAENIGMPLTRGDAEREPSQLTAEETMSKTPGNPVAPIRQEQDRALHKRLSDIEESTGGKAQTPESVGISVQDTALRAKEKASKQNYDKLFTKARETEPGATVTAEPLYELLKKDPDIQHFGWMESWLKKAKAKQTTEGAIDLSTDVTGAKGKAGTKEQKDEFKRMTLNELDDLRQAASRIARSPNHPHKFYAGEVLNALQKSFDQIPPAAKAWREALDAFKAHKKEFEDQKIVKDLATNKTRTDRRIAREDTPEYVLKQSKEDILKLKTSLHTGGTAETRAAGEQGWKDLQAGVLDYLREKASGRRGIKGSDAQAEFHSTFIDKFRELDRDGKIDAIFDKPTAAKLRELYEGVHDVRTRPSKRISGSDTAANLAANNAVENTLSGLEKLSKVKTFGKPLAGAIRILRSIKEKGEQTAQQARAKTTPTMESEEAVRKSSKSAQRKATRRKLTLKGLEAASRAQELAGTQENNNR